ncbi:MAG TPA: hypothetical protein PLL32_02365 [Anaeromyxobacteraceae bacterium]|nr:hypothetical protein [Anaeromyxobacteraceae bacterium]
MRREHLEHVIRAAAAISGDREIVVIGAAALLGSVPNPPDDLAQTMEADIYPLHRPHLADVIDGAIGELSPFHETFRYYAHGVGPSTALLPAGWRDRLVPVQGQGTGDSIGHCLDPCDLAASKLAAGREKDLAFVGGLLRHRIVTAAEVLARVGQLPLDEGRRREIAQRVAALG